MTELERADGWRDAFAAIIRANYSASEIHALEDWAGELERLEREHNRHGYSRKVD